MDVDAKVEAITLSIGGQHGKAAVLRQGKTRPIPQRQAEMARGCTCAKAGCA